MRLPPPEKDACSSTWLLARSLLLFTCCLVIATFAQADEPQQEGRILLLRRNHRVEYVSPSQRKNKRTSNPPAKTAQPPQPSPAARTTGPSGDPPVAEPNDLRQPETFSGWPNTLDSQPAPAAKVFSRNAEYQSPSAFPVVTRRAVEQPNSAETELLTPIQETPAAASPAALPVDTAGNPEFPGRAEHASIELPPVNPEADHPLKAVARSEPRQFVVGWFALNASHAVGFAFGLLLCVFFMFVVIAALLRLLASKLAQPISMEMNHPPTMADFAQSLHAQSPHAQFPTGPQLADPARELHAAGRETAVVDFATEVGSLEGLGATYQEEWMRKEQEDGEQELSIIEGIVDDNVAVRALMAKTA